MTTTSPRQLRVRPEPCTSCPYRTDVPSGVWAAEEYEKLPEYDSVTAHQPFGVFMCHHSPDTEICCGWACVHGRERGHELLALRLYEETHDVEVVIPSPKTPLFESGLAAAEHGIAEIEDPGPKARAAVARLERKIHQQERDRATP